MSKYTNGAIATTGTPAATPHQYDFPAFCARAHEATIRSALSANVIAVTSSTSVLGSVLL